MLAYKNQLPFIGTYQIIQRWRNLHICHFPPSPGIKPQMWQWRKSVPETLQGPGWICWQKPTFPPPKVFSSAYPILHGIRVSGNTNGAQCKMTTLPYYYWENKQKEKDFPVRRPYSTRFIHSFIFKCLLSSYCVECEVLGTESYSLANLPVTASWKST